MSVGTAKRRCAAIAAGLDIPRPFDLRRFLAHVERRRNRTIFLHPFTSGSGIPSGLWLGTATADHIFYEQQTSPWHQTHITVHEVAHMLLGHGGEGSVRDLAGLLAPDLNPALAQPALGHSAYTTAKERDAETLASLILGQASDSPAQLPARTLGAPAVLCRMEYAWDR